MMEDNVAKTPDLPQAVTDTPARKPLSPAAQRALAEAEARRTEYQQIEAAMPKEQGGRGGHDPVRYGDWEKKGIAVDF